jgi:hypothetical protein
MHPGKLVFAQLMEHLPLTTFRRCVARYSGHHKVERFSWFGLVPVDGLCATDVSRKSARYRNLSPRSVLQALPPGYSLDRSAQYLGQCQHDSGLAIYRDLAQSLIAMARRLYVDEPFGVA